MKHLKYAFTALALSLLAPSFAQNAGDVLNDWRAWIGTYEGRVDGRDALLTIDGEEVYEGLAFCWDITIEELDRGGVFTGEYCVSAREYDSLEDLASRTHILPRLYESDSLTLTDEDTGNTITIDMLLFHTWDENYITGVTEWNGRPYGQLWIRQDSGL